MKPHEQTPREDEQIKAAVRAILRDPESARFNLKYEMNTSGYYCGLVNSKNAFGGYSGFQVFLIVVEPYRSGSAGVVAVDASVGTDFVRSFCTERGYVF